MGRAARTVTLLVAIFLPVPAAAATLYGLIDTGEIFHSTDAGVSWTPIATLPIRDAVALSARLVPGDLFLASRSGTVYHSGDAGFGWTAVGTLPSSDVVDFVIQPDGALLVLTAGGSLYRSTDLGATFSGVATITAIDFVSLTVATGPPGIRYYALTRTGEVYESADAANSWTPRGALAVSQATQICAVGSVPYVLTDTGDIYRSADSGATWTAVGTLSQVGMCGLVRDGSSLAAASREGHVATSTDGITWSWRGSMNQLTLTALATNELAQSGVVPQPPPSVPFLVSGVYPNPTRGPASFRVHLETGAGIRLALFDVTGRLVAVRNQEYLAQGEQVVTWAPNVERTGVYYLRLLSGSREATTSWVIVH